MCEASSFHSQLGEGIQRHAEFATFEELHASGGHPAAIGSMAAQSLTCIPASTLLFEPERRKHPPRHVSAGTTSSYPQELTLPAYTMPRSYWSVKKYGSR
jgi:hypothetical protein